MIGFFFFYLLYLIKPKTIFLIQDGNLNFRINIIFGRIKFIENMVADDNNTNVE